MKSLLEQKLIKIISTTASSPTLDTASSLKASNHHELDLPPASQRTQKEIEMARNFMMNTVNTVFQPNTRLTLLEAIQCCQTATELRQAYLHWEDVLSTSRIGLKRLPEFKKKLFAVL
ncbi:hypothetical protein [Ottowia sp.]|uniref:hypothetical protein n=1 Tax=Ottowia sp. TaxID=1898956 RepID=UPI003A8B8B9F